jgi:hypothetical protein
MVNTGILIGIVVGMFFAGIGGAYTIFAASNNSDNIMNQQMIEEMKRHHQVMENMMMNNMMQQNMTGQDMMGNMMSRNSESDDSKNQPMGSMMGGNNMMSGMMNQIPQDVIVKVTSGQLTKVGKESKITLLVLDKETKKPLPDADVIIGIESGASMTTMNMMGGMFNAEDIGNGKYIVRFTPDTTGYYTMHTHVIPDGKSMHSMMENHLDIGIIVV